jgi:hypothetical protein
VKWSNLLAITLILAGAISLIFGWPWGSLVGAILILAGVIAKVSLPRTVQGNESSNENRGSQSQSIETSNSDPMVEAKALQKKIAHLESQGKPVPQQYYERLQVLVDAGLEKTFRNYHAVITEKGDQTIDLSEFARNLRDSKTGPLRARY